MTKLLIANWKMKPATVVEAIKLAKASDVKGVFIAPSFAFLSLVKSVLKNATLGSQDMFYENPKNGGAFTGAVSVSMLKSLGTKFAIIGHSERRAYFGETDEQITKKIPLAYENGLLPVLCVGESWSVRQRGITEAKAFVALQLAKDLSRIPPTAKKIVIAYEPIWAIGTGNNDTPENAGDMARHIRSAVAKGNSGLSAQVLYGGSVNAKNIASFAKEKNIDGFLVGGARADAKEWKAIVKIVAKL
ncbi:MAG: triose-phosphate isomerase [Patescibacteria group bacterium]